MDLNLEKLSNLEDVSLDQDALIHGERAKNIFCASWPTAKKVLEALATIIKNPGLKIIIKAVIALGEGFASKYCG
ncbi:MAG: hypothetical protein GC181_02885 [Bacteroidetes bacterium]|nr:hypothetical protein [Bacteroidota bacterium]